MLKKEKNIILYILLALDIMLFLVVLYFLHQPIFNKSVIYFMPEWGEPSYSTTIINQRLLFYLSIFIMMQLLLESIRLKTINILGVVFSFLVFFVYVFSPDIMEILVGFGGRASTTYEFNNIGISVVLLLILNIGISSTIACLQKRKTFKKQVDRNRQSDFE